MKADAITGKIMEDARGSASQTLKDADVRAQKMRADNDRLIDSQREAAMEQARRDCAELRDRMLRMAELDQRKEMLAMKRGVIDAAFDEALKNMRAMSAQKARGFMESMLIDACEGDEVVIVSKGDEKVFDGEYIASINAKIAASGKPGKLTLSNETRELGGGLMLSRGGMEVNLTYPSVISEKRPELEAEVAGMLFD